MKKLYEESSIQDIADAIREKNGTEETYKPSEMGDAVRAIQSGGGGVDYLEYRIGANATNFYEYYNENIKELKQQAFAYDGNLVAIDLPNCEQINNQCFYTAHHLERINFPSLKKIQGSQHFQGTKLKEIYLLGFDKTVISANSGLSGEFRATVSLKKVEYNYLKQVVANAFNGCTSFNALVIRGDSLATLANISAFNNTPIANGTGYIYVPSALIEDYKVATNWVTFADQFRALEDYTVDGTTTGELDESKIAA